MCHGAARCSLTHAAPRAQRASLANGGLQERAWLPAPGQQHSVGKALSGYQATHQEWRHPRPDKGSNQELAQGFRPLCSLYGAHGACERAAAQLKNTDPYLYTAHEKSTEPAHPYSRACSYNDIHHRAQLWQMYTLMAAASKGRADSWEDYSNHVTLRSPSRDLLSSQLSDHHLPRRFSSPLPSTAQRASVRSWQAPSGLSALRSSWPSRRAFRCRVR